MITRTFELCKVVEPPGAASGIAREVDALDGAIVVELVDVST